MPMTRLLDKQCSNKTEQKEKWIHVFPKGKNEQLWMKDKLVHIKTSCSVSYFYWLSQIAIKKNILSMASHCSDSETKCKYTPSYKFQWALDKIGSASFFFLIYHYLPRKLILVICKFSSWHSYVFLKINQSRQEFTKLTSPINFQKITIDFFFFFWLNGEWVNRQCFYL